MFGLRSLFRSRPNLASQNRARLNIEQFKCRALPSGFGSVLPIAGAGQVIADFQHIRSDVQSLTRLVGSQASGQLATVRADVTKLVADAVAGSSSAVTADLKTLSTDEAALVKSLGSPLGGRAATIFTNLQRDILALNADVAGLGTTHRGHDRGDDDDREGHDLGQTGTVIRDLVAVRNDLRALTGILGSKITPAVTNDIKAVQTALGSVIGDLVNGTSPTKDLTNLNTALTTLTKDVGSGTPAQGILTALTNDIQKLTTDVNALTNPTQAALARVQADVKSLESALGSNLSTAAKADVAALDAAIAALGADVAAGKAIATDLGNALTSEFNLLRDLTSPLPAGARQSLVRLAADLVRLSPVLSV